MAKLIGGPCDGKDVGPALYTSYPCKGTKYTLYEDGNYHALIHAEQGLNIKPVLKAWHSLQRAWNADTHRCIDRMARASVRMRRATR